MEDSSTKKSQSIDPDMKEVAFQLFLSLLPKIDETNEPETQEKKKGNIE